MKINITFNMDSAAFDDNAATETSRILRGIAKRVLDADEGGRVFDLNGNTIGSWEVTG